MSSVRTAAASVALGLVVLAAHAVAAAPAYKAPRTPFGAPDLQGEWTNVSYTGLVRPKDFKAPTATEAEALAWMKKVQDIQAGRRKPDGYTPSPEDIGDIESE